MTYGKTNHNGARHLKMFTSGMAIILIAALLVFGIASPAYAQQEGIRAEVLGVLTFFYLTALVVMIAAFAGFALLMRGLFPKKTEWTGEILRRMPWGSFWFGLIGWIVTLIIGFGIASLGEAAGSFAALLLLVFIFMFVSFGKVALIEWAGELIDPASVGIRRALLGSGSLFLLMGVPILGWLMLPVLCCMGTGAALYSYIPPKTPAPAPPPQQQDTYDSNVT